MAKLKDSVSKETLENIKLLKYQESKEVFGNLRTVIKKKYGKGNKVQMKNKRIHKIYVEIPLSVGLKYDLIAINIPIYSKHHTEQSINDTKEVIVYTIGKNKCEEVNGKFYAWVKPIMYQGKLSCIFGRSIDRFNEID